jgi:hypothetical protein
MLFVMASPYSPPPIETATDPVHSTVDLCRRWQALMGPLGFGERLLWFTFIGSDRCIIKVLNQIPVPVSPAEHYGVELFSKLRGVLDAFEPNTTVALLLTRPGAGGISNADRRWSTMLTETAARFAIPLEPIFRANSTAVVHVEPGRGEWTTGNSTRP